MTKKLLILIPFVFIAAFSVRFVILANKSQEMKVKLGIVEGSLTPCKSESNCFRGKVEVLKEETWKNLQRNLSQKGMTEEDNQEKEGRHYLHFTDKSPLFGFVDDVEFLFLPQKKTLYFRSSSRVGKSDLGANKERIINLLKSLKIPFNKNAL